MATAFRPAIAAFLTAILIAGCATTGRTPKEDAVTGYYVGHWYGPNPERPLGELTCTVVPAENAGQWHATFFATFGETGTYEVPLEGRREGDRVLFGGAANLGASDGVYEWTGEIVGDRFNGTYSGGGLRGTFRMTRAEKDEE